MTDNTSDDKQMLTVSSPCLLLNHIAQRYTRTSRIIMEYVDNSLDDAEALYSEKTDSYRRRVNILVEMRRQKVVEESGSQSDVEDVASTKANVTENVDDKTGEIPKKKGKSKKKPQKKENWITEVTVTDNCRGMTNATLNRLIANIGDSTKRYSKFTNGHFGFGVHAFRACAKNIEFKSKAFGKKTLGLKMDRDNEYFSKPKYIKEEGVLTKTGTIVKVSNFDNTWSEQLEPKEIIREIQHHFSGLLQRKNLLIEVKDVVKDITTVCKPINYKKLNLRQSVRKSYKFDGGSIRIRLFVAEKAQSGKNCMFISKGRRVNEISDVKSFMKMSRCKFGVWSHPNLLGYIDVSNVLDPVITRDEFRLNSSRKQVYRKVIEEIEPLLYKSLHEVNENRKVMALARLEDVVSKCVNFAVKKDQRRQHDGMSYLQQMMLSKKPVRRKTIDEDFDVENPISKKRKTLDDNDDTNPEGNNKKEEDKAEEVDADGKPLPKKRRTGFGFNIAFVKDLNKESGEPCRARLIGDAVQINMRHPDFLTRIKVNKSDSRPIVTERLCAYLANIIAGAYKSHAVVTGGGLDRYKEDNSVLLDEILDITLSLEGQLRSKLKLMQREMETGAEAAAHHAKMMAAGK